MDEKILRNRIMVLRDLVERGERGERHSAQLRLNEMQEKYPHLFDGDFDSPQIEVQNSVTSGMVMVKCGKQVLTMPKSTHLSTVIYFIQFKLELRVNDQDRELLGRFFA